MIKGVVQEVKVKSNIDLKQNNILCLDKEGNGQKFFVKEELGNNTYIISLVTLDQKEEIFTIGMDGKTTWYVIAYVLEEYRQPPKNNTNFGTRPTLSVIYN